MPRYDYWRRRGKPLHCHPFWRKKFEARSPGALFVALSRGKSAGGEDVDPDFAWHPNVLINEDRLCQKVRTETTKASVNEIKRIDTITENTKRAYPHLFKKYQFPPYEFPIQKDEAVNYTYLLH